MKRIIILLVLTVILVLNSAPMSAHFNPEKNQARHVIQRTAAVLVAAQKAAAREEKYFGLARAVTHQMHARELYRQGFYADAIYHSLRGRELAALVIRENRGEFVRESVLDRMELKYKNSSPSDDQLDVKIQYLKITDDSAMKIKIDLDI